MKLNKSNHCLNCNEEIKSSNYCPKCGQLNSDKKLTLKQILSDFLGDYFTFDSKFFRSLIPLVIKPGYLTREYIKGKRVQYIFPLRLYIFTTFVFFFVLSLNTKIDYDKFVKNTVDSTQTENQIPDNIVTLNSTDSLLNSQGDWNFSFQDSTIEENSFTNYLINKAKYLASLGKDGSDIFFREVINQIPKVMFILLPIFALILKLVYVRSKILYVEHLVFSLHIHTFFFLIMIFTIFISNTFVNIGFLVLIMVYLFFSILNFYQQSIFKSAVKIIMLVGLYIVALIPSLVLLLFLAFLSV